MKYQKMKMERGMQKRNTMHAQHAGKQITGEETSRAGGAVLLITLAMTAMLMFLGVFFYSFTAAERNSASMFAVSTREVTESDYFDFALQQILIGPTDDQRNSALYGRKHSMIPNMLGSFGPDLRPTNYQPFTGRGIEVLFNDTTGDGLPNDNTFTFNYGDPTYNNTVLNFSPGANKVGAGGVAPSNTSTDFPASPLGNSDHYQYVPTYEPDAGYTYPDINSMFLGYFSLIDVAPDASTEDLRYVWIPSFQRPQYLSRDETVDIYSDATYVNQVLRPHKEHVVRLRYRDPGDINNVLYKTVPRYISGTNNFDAVTGSATGPAAPFPFPTFTSGSVSTDYEAGLWTGGLTRHTDIQYDIDADGLAYNGKEAIWMDFNHGVEILADGRKRIPIYGVTIIDADGLANINTGGNLYGEPTSLAHDGDGDSGGGKFGNGTYITRSNFGLSMGEVNLGRTFYRPLDQPGGTPTLLPNDYEKMFGIDIDADGESVTQVDMANMELARLLLGNADGNTADNSEVIPGRWGDETLLDVAVLAARSNIGNTSVITAPQPPYPANSWQSSFDGSLTTVSFPYSLSLQASTARLALFPAPGQPGYDDDADYYTAAGKARVSGSRSRDSVFGSLGISIPPSVHPGDELGIGRYAYLSDGIASEQYSATTNHGAQRQTTTTATFNLATIDTYQLNPGRWINYGAGFEYQLPVVSSTPEPNVGELYSSTATTPVAGVTPYSQAGYEGLFGWGELNQHVQAFSVTEREWGLYARDEPDEIAVEPAFRNLNDDALFSVSDMTFLHLSDTDWDKLGSPPNRLEELLQFNCERLTATEATTGFTETNAIWLRSQLTTDSWARWEYGMARPVDSDDDGNLQDENRGWEFNDNLSNLEPDGVANSGTDTWRFPPSFASSSGADHAPYGKYDPIRSEIRQWLTIEYGTNLQKIFKQNRLDLNRLLVFDPDAKELVFRHLTPHPVGGSTGANDDLPEMEHENILDPRDSRLEFQFKEIQGNRLAQEWWARFDRQRMARDIYVLLYTLGGGDDTINYTENNTPGTNQLYTETQLREMAQFAVNVVDGLDRDDVITEFVYDTNLGDGWDITGDKVAATGELNDTTGETARVFGIERQSLCFSESLWIKTEANKMSDEDETIFDDSDMDDRHHFFLELQNASAFPVSLDGGNWRIRRVDVDTSANPDTETTIGSAVFKDGTAGSYSSGGEIVDVANIVEPGGYYTIGHHDGNDDNGSGDQRPSDLRVKSGTAMPVEYQVLAPQKHARWRHNTTTTPAATTATDSPEPWTDLDLTWESGAEEARYEFRDDTEAVVDNSTTKGFLLDNTTTATETTFILERRLNLNVALNFDTSSTTGYNKQKVWNPWVEVDRITMEQTTFDPETPTSSSDLKSKEIPEPLDSININDYTGTPTGPDSKSYNTLGELNSLRNADQFTIWQPHFDRDYTSIYELLSTPIFGPSPKTVDSASDEHIANGGVTKMLSNGQRRLSGLSDVNGSTVPVTAGMAKFLRPDNDPSAVTASAGTKPDPASSLASNDNRWYRLFEFYEVKTTAQSAFRDDLPIPRTPGKVNLNTIRHPGVLASIIDDTYHLRDHVSPISTDEAGNAKIPFRQLRDTKETDRDWGHEFFRSRDVPDPVLSTSSNVYLPGIPGSRPFRSLSYLGNADPTTYKDVAKQTIDQTILRSLPKDGTTQEESVLNRRLFEARTNTDVNSSGTGFPTGDASKDVVDYHTRNRLLSKIANNTTTNSNVFYCWIYVQFHEAAEDEFGNVQVGGVLADQPVHRAFFVIDRSKLEEAWDPKTRTFDYQKFIILRNVIQ